MILLPELEFTTAGMSWRTPVLEYYLNMFEIITVSKCLHLFKFQWKPISDCCEASPRYREVSCFILY